MQFRAGADPVLYLNNPDGITAASRRKMLDRLGELHRIGYEESVDPVLDARIAQYEMAYRMQTSVPEVTDLSDEPDSTFDLYGPDARDPGTFAANCLLARRLAERGVRFIQLYHQGWDQHGNLPGGIRQQCRETDQGAAALLIDLKQRGLLDDTLVIWGGEFGRTNYSQGKLTPDRLRPRPPPALLHRLDGRRRRQAGHQLRRRPTTSATTSPRTRSTSTTSTRRSSTSSASTTSG